MIQRAETTQTNQRQIQGALVGLVIGVIAGAIYAGLGGAIAGGVGGLFIGGLLGALLAKVDRRLGQILIGVILLALVFFLVQNYNRNNRQTTSESEAPRNSPSYDGYNSNQIP